MSDSFECVSISSFLLASILILVLCATCEPLHLISGWVTLGSNNLNQTFPLVADQTRTPLENPSFQKYSLESQVWISIGLSPELTPGSLWDVPVASQVLNSPAKHFMISLQYIFPSKITIQPGPEEAKQSPDAPSTLLFVCLFWLYWRLFSCVLILS